MEYKIDDIEFKNQNGIDKNSIINEYRTADSDTGSAGVQIALIVKRVRYLTDNHFSNHKGDKHSRLGLTKLVSKAKKLLKYLYRVNYDEYVNITQKLEITKWLKTA